MAKKKFYAVKQGRKTGMFLTWDDCKKQVMGYPGAIYKSFGTREEAEAYLGVTRAQIDQKDRKAGITRSVSSGNNKSENTENAVEIYVDGSYHAATKEFSYGMVVLVDGKEEKFFHISCFFGSKQNPVAYINKKDILESFLLRQVFCIFPIFPYFLVCLTEILTVFLF